MQVAGESSSKRIAAGQNFVEAQRWSRGALGSIEGLPALRTPLYDACKRTLDLLVGGLALLISVPFILVIGALVRLDSPGPVIFRQVRVGKGGKLFRFYKFRTMVLDARERFPELYSYQYSDSEFRAMYLKTAEDPRLTRLGRFLRTTSLDELPNFINVVRGEMSLVGPRPEIPEMISYYGPEQLPKFSVKPGVTGLWQVSGRARLRYQEMIAADVEYVRRRSFLFDLKLLARTAKVVLLRDGAI